jgi:hypothetical protein
MKNFTRLKMKYNLINKANKKETIDKELTTHKRIVKELEKKLIDKSVNEEKLRKENESFKRQIQFYKDKMKLDMVAKRIKSPVKRKMNSTESLECLDKQFDKKSREETPERDSKVIKVSKGIVNSDNKKAKTVKIR